MSKIKNTLEAESIKRVEEAESEQGYRFDEKNHVHTLDGKPLIGTSTAVGIIAKPLTWWASGLAVGVFGWMNPKTTPKEVALERATNALEAIKGLGVEEYQGLLQKAYKAHSEKLETSAESGTDMHALLETFVKDRMAGKEAHLEGNLKSFEEWTDKNVGQFLWSEGHCYSEKLWVGGISDCGALLKDKSLAVIDFKSSKEAYTSQFIQCAGYGIQMKENGVFDKYGKSIFLSPTNTTKFSFGAYIVVPFGAKDPTPCVKRNVEELETAFVHACELYKFVNINQK